MGRSFVKAAVPEAVTQFESRLECSSLRESTFVVSASTFASQRALQRVFN